jgi:SAM-dependent methyltransferase
VAGDVSIDQSYDDFPRIEEAFRRRLDETLDPRGPAHLWDLFAGLRPQRGDLVVDVGCGEGDDAVELARRFDVAVLGVDPVARHVEVGRERAAVAGLEDRVRLELGTAERLPLGAGAAALAWSKEVLMYADLGNAFAELRRVLRPGGGGLVYQVCTGPAMGDEEAAAFWREAAAASSVRPDDLAAAIEAAGLSVAERVDYGSEWGEAASERSGEPGRRLVHAARLLRAPDRYVEEFGEAAYRIMLGDCLWHVYRMIGRLAGAAFTFRSP